MHHGILGQRWGIRRYRNRDGSLTPAGKKRYDSYERAIKPGKDDKPSPARRIASSSKDITDESTKIIKEIQKGRKPSFDDLSDQELQKRINRLRLEQQYSDLTGANSTKGEDFMLKLLTIVGSTAAIGASTVAIVEGVKKIKGG